MITRPQNSKGWRDSFKVSSRPQQVWTSGGNPVDGCRKSVFGNGAFLIPAGHHPPLFQFQGIQRLPHWRPPSGPGPRQCPTVPHFQRPVGIIEGRTSSGSILCSCKGHSPRNPDAFSLTRCSCCCYCRCDSGNEMTRRTQGKKGNTPNPIRNRGNETKMTSRQKSESRDPIGPTHAPKYNFDIRKLLHV